GKFRRSTDSRARGGVTKIHCRGAADREIECWVGRIEVGNLYVNRPITGAMVGRQPFGGWTASSAGPGASSRRPTAPRSKSSRRFRGGRSGQGLTRKAEFTLVAPRPCRVPPPGR